LPYELLTGDMGDISDRVLRVLLNDFRRRIEQLQFGVYVFQLCRPVRIAWLDAAVLAGSITLPDYSRRRREYLRTRWVPQGHPYIHPVQDVDGKLKEIKGGLASRSEQDRKSTRLNSSHVKISYAVFCLKKKNKKRQIQDA